MVYELEYAEKRERGTEERKEEDRGIRREKKKGNKEDQSEVLLTT